MNHELNNTSFPNHKNILDNLLDAVLVVNKDGIIIYANRAAGLIFNSSADDLLGVQFGYPVEFGETQELKIIRGKQVRIAQMLVSTVEWNAETANLVSLRDITGLKSISKELSQQKQQLEAANEELQQYANVSSHDLKEPVRKILVYTEILLEEHLFNANEEARKKLVKICNAARSMKTLIAGIAEYSRVGMSNVSIEDVNLNKVINDVLADLELKIKETGAKVIAGYIPKIEAVPLQMHQLFLNLISNSIKYCEAGVVPVIIIWSEEDDETITVTLKDNGIGFEQEFAEKILQPFTRLHSKEYEGSGIGLAICKKILDAHRAELDIQSIPGEGSTFRIRFRKYQE